MQVLREYDFKCAITGKGGTLQVHHASKPFYQIRDAVLQDLGIKRKRNIRKEFSEEEVILITKKFIEKHHCIIGVPMLVSVHKLFHKVYGYNTEISDVWEFRLRYLAEEFH